MRLLALAFVCCLVPASLFAAHAEVQPAGSVWISGSWVSCNGSYTWRPGYWQTSQTTVCTTTPARWVEGHWAQGANGWVWVEGHYEEPSTVCTTVPTCPPPVVYQQPCQPRTTVSVGVGYGYGYHNYPDHCDDRYRYRDHCDSRRTGVVVTSRPVSRTTYSPTITLPSPPSVNLPCPPRVNLPSPPRISLPKPSIGSIKLPKLPNPFR